MLSFTKWLQNESSRGLMRGLRKRVSLFAPYIHAGVHPELGLPVDYKSAADARRDLTSAAERAQEINRQHPNGITVYHAIVLKRMTRSLDSRLAFLTSKKPNEEQSVSVTKGVWEANLVLVGTASKLLYYWGTDIHTKPIPGNRGWKIPLDAHRPLDFRPYDEALINLKDVNWHTLYVNDENPEVINTVGGMGAIRKLAVKYGLRLKSAEDISPEESPLRTRYSVQVTINKLSRFNSYLYDMLLNLTSSAQDSDDVHPAIQDYCKQVRDELLDKDPEHKDLVKYPVKRAEAMEQTFRNLSDVFKYLHQFIGTNDISF